MKLLIENWRKFLDEELIEEGVESLHLPGIINTKILETITGGHAQTTFGKYFKEIAPLLYSSTMHRFVKAAGEALHFALEDWVEEEMAKVQAKTPDGDSPDYRSLGKERRRQQKGATRLQRRLVDKVEGELVDKGPQEDVREGGYSDLYIELVNQMRPVIPEPGERFGERGKTGKDFWKFLRGYVKNVKKTVAKVNFGVAGEDMDVNDFIKERFLKLFYPKIDEIYLTMWERTTGETHQHRLDTSGIPKVSMQSLIKFLNGHEKNWTKVDEIYNEYGGHPDMWGATLDYLEQQKYKESYNTDCKGWVEQGPPCVALKLEDDWFWYNRGTNACSVFARELANCGDTTRSESVLMDLQQFKEGDKKPKYAVGVEWDNLSQTIYQILGNANSFPDKKYWPQIKALFEFLGKPDIDSDAFGYISGMTPRQIEDSTREFFKAIGHEVLDDWDLLRQQVRHKNFDMSGKSPNYNIDLTFKEVVPYEGGRLAVQAHVAFAHKIKKEFMPDQFIADLNRWWVEEGDSAVDEAVEKAREALEYQLIHSARNSKYFQELGWKPKRVMFARRNWTGGSAGTAGGDLVWLFNMEINQFQTSWGARQTGASTPETIRKFIRTVKRNIRIPVFRSEVGTSANEAWMERLKLMYPDAVPYRDSELFGESKKIKVSIIK